VSYLARAKHGKEVRYGDVLAFTRSSDTGPSRSARHVAVGGTRVRVPVEYARPRVDALPSGLIVTGLLGFQLVNPWWALALGVGLTWDWHGARIERARRMASAPNSNSRWHGAAFLARCDLLLGRLDDSLAAMSVLYDTRKAPRGDRAFVAASIALIHGIRGDADSARQWLERGRITDGTERVVEVVLRLREGAYSDALAIELDENAAVTSYRGAVLRILHAFSLARSNDVIDNDVVAMVRSEWPEMASFLEDTREHWECQPSGAVVAHARLVRPPPRSRRG
jgi:hypothetical protein